MTSYQTAPEDRIPLGQKIAFGIGMLCNQMFPAALSIFMVVLVKGSIPAMYAAMAPDVAVDEEAADANMEVVCYKIP